MSDTLSAAAIATSQDEKIRQRAYKLWENEGAAAILRTTGSERSRSLMIRVRSVQM